MGHGTACGGQAHHPVQHWGAASPRPRSSSRAWHPKSSRKTRSGCIGHGVSTGRYLRPGQRLEQFAKKQGAPQHKPPARAIVLCKPCACASKPSTPPVPTCRGSRRCQPAMRKEGPIGWHCLPPGKHSTLRVPAIQFRPCTAVLQGGYMSVSRGCACTAVRSGVGSARLECALQRPCCKG